MRMQKGNGLFLCVFNLLFVVTFVEFVDSSARVYVFLLARIERMALTAHVYLNHVPFFGGPGYEFGAAGAFHRYLVVIGMNILFHCAFSL